MLLNSRTLTANPVATALVLTAALAGQPALATCDPLPREVDGLVVEALAGPELSFHWDDISDADGYVVFQDTSASGGFSTQTGVAASGTSGLDVPMPLGTLFFLVAAQNATCGQGPRGSAPGDLTPPLVNIEDPATMGLVSSLTVTVSGTVVGASLTEVVVKGVPATINAGTFTATGIALSEGRNVITAIATDPFHNVGTHSITLTLDTAPPNVVIELPLDGSTVGQTSIDVVGRVSDLSSSQSQGNTINVTVDVDGTAYPTTVVNGSFLAAGIPLLPRPQTITATATDAVGNVGVASVNASRADLAGQQISAVSGTGQSSPVRAVLPSPLVVQLSDINGSPVPNRPVVFTVTRSAGTVNELPVEGPDPTVQVMTDALGRAQVFQTLGTRAGAGNNRVTATSPGFAGEAIFCSTAQPDVPVSLRLISGDGQRSVAGLPCPNPFVVLVQDKGGNPVPNISVTFEVLMGDGAFDGMPTLIVATGEEGLAAVTFTLGPDLGHGGNLAQASIVTASGPAAVVFLPIGVGSGRPEDTALSGVVLDNSDEPIESVTVSVLDSVLQTVTDSAGRFSITGIPVGHFTLEVDGTTTSRPGTWPVLHFEIEAVSGLNNVQAPYNLLPLDTANSALVGGATDVTLSMADVPGVALTVFANSVTCPGGASQCVAMITQVHRDKVPMPPPGGAAPSLVWTIQPSGIVFDPPARITYPNTNGLPDGLITEFFSFDHDIGEFLAIGTGTVSADRSVITSDPGSGIRKGGWGYPRIPCRDLSQCVKKVAGSLWQALCDATGNCTWDESPPCNATIGVRG